MATQIIGPARDTRKTIIPMSFQDRIFIHVLPATLWLADFPGRVATFSASPQFKQREDLFRGLQSAAQDVHQRFDGKLGGEEWLDDEVVAAGHS